MKSAYLKILFFLFVAFLIESALIRVFAPSRILPQLLLMTVVAIAIQRSLQEALWLSFFAGFLLEIFSGLFFGSYIFSFLLSCLLVVFLTRKITSRDLTNVSGSLIVLTISVFFPLSIYIYTAIFSTMTSAPIIPFGSLWSVHIFLLFFFNLIFFKVTKFIFDIFIKSDEKSF